MKLFSLMILISYILQGCMSNEYHHEQTAYYRSFLNKPLTDKEKAYKQKLLNVGYDSVDIQPPTVGVDAQGTSGYSISVYTAKIDDGYNRDSLKQCRTQIAYDLYKDVIEDSIIYEFGEIYVKMYIKMRNNELRERYDIWAKEFLEEDLGFKVIKKDKDKFERVKVEKSDSRQ